MRKSEKTRAGLGLRAELLQRGLTLADFARLEGFKLITGKKVFLRYWGTGEIPPRGPISQAIFYRLRQYCGHSEPSSTPSTRDLTSSTPMASKYTLTASQGQVKTPSTSIRT